MSVPTEGFSPENVGQEPKKHGFVSRGEKPVTMAVVARIAGLSQGAISSLLNDRDYGIRVSLKNRERVFKVCRDVGYEPNDLRALVRIYPELGETCLLVSDKIGGGIANPFVGRLIAALMAHLPRQPASIGVILYSDTHDYTADASMPGPLKHGTASKILCVGAANDAICRVVHERSLPAIMLGHTAHMPGVTSIVPDYPDAARLAMGLLHGHGHRHIGIVSGPFGSHDPRLTEMNVAIGDAAAQLGLTIAAEDIFSGDLNFEAGKRTLFPSGDQRGRKPKDEMRRSFPPSTGTTKMPPPSRSERKTRLLPLGDQSGSQSCAGDFVTCTGLPPATGCTQISKLPLRSEL